MPFTGHYVQRITALVGTGAEYSFVDCKPGQYPRPRPYIDGYGGQTVKKTAVFYI